MKEWKPKFFENSRLPVWLSKIVPIEVHAFSFGPFVWCRTEMNGRTKQHETIHFQQQLEMGFIFRWILYAAFYVYGYIKHHSGFEAYMMSPFEREAYDNDEVEGYLSVRPRWAWAKYVGKSS